MLMTRVQRLRLVDLHGSILRGMKKAVHDLDLKEGVRFANGKRRVRKHSR